MAEDGKGRIARWSERKARHRGGAIPVAERESEAVAIPLAGEDDALPAPVPDAEASVPTSADETPPLDAEAIANLPPVESLDKDSDYTPFLAQGVPEKLAKAALRKLWRSNRAFNLRDGLDDYDEDFTLVEAIKEFVTSGKGGGTAPESDDDMIPSDKARAESAAANEEMRVAEEAEDAEEKAKPADDTDGDTQSAAGEGDDDTPEEDPATS